MDKGSIDFGPILHEVVHPDSHIVCQETFPKDLGFDFQSLLQGHLCTLQDGLLNKRVDLSNRPTKHCKCHDFLPLIFNELCVTSTNHQIQLNFSQKLTKHFFDVNPKD
jgi:hypothetical protein